MMQPFFFPHFCIVSKRILTATESIQFREKFHSVQYYENQCEKDAQNQQLPLLNVSMCEVMRFRKKYTILHFAIQ